MQEIMITGDSGSDTLDKLRELLEDARETFGGGDCSIVIEDNRLILFDDYGNDKYVIKF